MLDAGIFDVCEIFDEMQGSRTSRETSMGDQNLQALLRDRRIHESFHCHVLAGMPRTDCDHYYNGCTSLTHTTDTQEGGETVEVACGHQSGHVVNIPQISSPKKKWITAHFYIPPSDWFEAFWVRICTLASSECTEQESYQWSKKIRKEKQRSWKFEFATLRKST